MPEPDASQPWEPAYGFCGMCTTDNETLAKALEDIRRRICLYGGGRCDCKYGRDGTAERQGGEASGSLEMTELINRLMHRPTSFSEEAVVVLKRFTNAIDSTLKDVGITGPLRDQILTRFLFGQTGRFEDVSQGTGSHPT